MKLAEIVVGQPLIFKSSIYGDTAVHVTSIYNEVVHFSIDGGEASRQVREFSELSDGMYFALASRLEKRTKQASPRRVKVAAEKAMTAPRKACTRCGDAHCTENAKCTAHPAGHGIATHTTKSEPRKRRMSLSAALVRAREMADRNPTHFKWANNEVETF